MKALTEMNNRELFCVLTGDKGVLPQAQLQDIIHRYKRKYPERAGKFGEMDLSAIVAEMTAES